jgi:DNA repair exonuclease SbcCD ATPase subunit
MLKIKSVSMRNFLSVGNATQAVVLNKEGLTLVLGENLDNGGVNSRNGVGKSTLLQAVSFGLFGQPLTNIKKDNLINNINGKNLVVSIDFEKDGKAYRIERGRKPTFMRYYVGDNLVQDPTNDEAQGENKFTQIEIERVLGFSHDMFRHIIALNTYTEPFLKMRPGDQRQIIEELLGITQLSTRADVLKELIKNTKDSIRDEEARIKAVIAQNDKMRSTISDLMLKSRGWDQARDRRILQAESQLTNLRNLDIEVEIEKHKKLGDFKVLTTELNRTKRDLRRMEGDLLTKNSSLERYLTDLSAAENHHCPTCGQETHDGSNERIIAELKEKIAKIEPELIAIATEVEEHSTVVKQLEEGLALIGDEPITTYASLEQALEHRNTINNLLETISRETESVNPYQDQINTLETSGIQEVSYETLNELQVLLKHQDFLLKMLTSKDSFIRKKIIDQNINHLNHRLNFYLEKLALPHEVTFHSDLSVEINLLGRDFDFEQLSRGESTRVILATSWAFRDVWESLNQTVNLLFVDEMVDNGLDQQGSENALDLMKRMARDRNKNIFLISHKDDLVGRVNKLLLVKKENSFTRFDNDAEDIE